ncbi:tetratricopeptide repeat protein [Nannocystis pusilla]|uniref:Tetratricopeptide repeat protein n=1 Tax=Nannocystis pusilla TaxID=889268 RepID=A0A9X3F0C5_9BACT|nr:tetratricopeptide repeat protein [Nannocystis pusilla]
MWSEARADALREAFVATGLTYAADTAQRVAPLVDAYAGAWAASRRASCEAHRRGQQSDALFDLSMACLDRRRAGLVALTDLLVHADAALVDRAIEATLGLPPVTACTDATALTTETRVPDEPTLARGVAAERLRLAEAEVLLGAGRFTAAAEAAGATLARAEALGFSPLVAESALVLGTTELEQTRGEAAERALTTALRRGIEGRADRTAAEAVARRLYVRGVQLGRDEAAGSDEELVIAHVGRFPADGRLQWLAYNNRGTRMHMRQEVAAARSLYEQALAHTQGPTPLELARTRVNLGSLAAEARDYAAALASYSAALAEATAALGPGHPLVQQILVYEAKALQSLGRHALARARIEQALQHVAPAGQATPAAMWPFIRLSDLERRRGARAKAAELASRALALAQDDLLGTINAETMLAEALDDPIAAQEHYAAALARCEASFGERHMITASFQRHAAAGLLRLGQASEAQAWIRRSLATCEALDPSAAVTAESRRVASDIALALGQHEEALASARASLALLAALPGDRALDVAAARRSLGRALLAAGRDDEASEALRAALESMAPRLDADDPDLAGARVELARALLADEASRAPEARALLEPAIATYRVLGATFAGQREAAERLLADP